MNLIGMIGTMTPFFSDHIGWICVVIAIVAVACMNDNEGDMA